MFYGRGSADITLDHCHASQWTRLDNSSFSCHAHRELHCLPHLAAVQLPEHSSCSACTLDMMHTDAAVMLRGGGGGIIRLQRNQKSQRDAWAHLGKICSMSRNLVGNHACLDVVPVWQPQVLFWGDIAQKCRACSVPTSSQFARLLHPSETLRCLGTSNQVKWLQD